MMKQALELLKQWVTTSREIKQSIHCDPKDIESLSTANTLATAEMKSIANDYGADRVGISMFHNGTYSLHNTHTLRLSVITEGLSGRVGPIMPTTQGRMVAEYGDLGGRIINNHETIKVLDVESMHHDLVGFADFLKIHFVKSFYFLPLFVINGAGKKVVDASLFLHYCGDGIELSSEELDVIQARAQAVYNELSKANGNEHETS